LSSKTNVCTKWSSVSDEDYFAAINRTYGSKYPLTIIEGDEEGMHRAGYYGHSDYLDYFKSKRQWMPKPGGPVVPPRVLRALNYLGDREVASFKYVLALRADASPTRSIASFDSICEKYPGLNVLGGTIVRHYKFYDRGNAAPCLHDFAMSVRLTVSACSIVDADWDFGYAPTLLASLQRSVRLTSILLLQVHRMQARVCTALGLGSHWRPRQSMHLARLQ
jgi:hypothetical protein